MNTPDDFLHTTLKLLAHMPRDRSSYVVASVQPNTLDGFSFHQTIVFCEPLSKVEADAAIMAKTSPFMLIDERRKIQLLVSHCIALRGQIAILEQAANARVEISETQQQVKGEHRG
jgi:hypothetical protein